MNVKERLQRALKQERGLRLTAVEVQGLAGFLNLDFPKKPIRRRSPSPSKPPSEGFVRYMICKDMPAVLAIDAAVSAVPWTKTQFRDCLRKRNCIGMVMELPGRRKRDAKVVGFMIYELHKHRFDLERIAVDPDHQLQSVGRQMIEKLRGKMSAERRRFVKVTVNQSNLAAQLFFQANGFTATEQTAETIVMQMFWNDDPRPFGSPAEFTADQSGQSDGD